MNTKLTKKNQAIKICSIKNSTFSYKSGLLPLSKTPPNKQILILRIHTCSKYSNFLFSIFIWKMSRNFLLISIRCFPSLIKLISKIFLLLFLRMHVRLTLLFYLFIFLKFFFFSQKNEKLERKFSFSLFVFIQFFFCWNFMKIITWSFVTWMGIDNFFFLVILSRSRKTF